MGKVSRWIPEELEVGFMITTPRNENYKVVELTSFDCGDCSVQPSSTVCMFNINCKHRKDGRFLCWERATKQEIDDYNNKPRSGVVKTKTNQ